MTNIAFFGTSDRSLPILESLKARFDFDIDLVLCVTRDDVLVGRHQKPKETEVKRWATENGVNFVTIGDSINNAKDAIIEQIKLSRAEIGVVADFGFIIPQAILNAFPHGLVNIHFSLLPKYRGASPVQFAILNGDTETGITYQLMEQSLDTGPILSQLNYALNGMETSGDVYMRLFNLSADHLPTILKKYLDGRIKPTPQNETRATYTYSPTHPHKTHIFKEDAKIDWSKPAEQLERCIRAYNPWPIAWTTLGEMHNSQNKLVGFTNLKDQKNISKVIKLYSAKLASNGKLAVEQLQLEGGRVLAWQEFKNGYLM